MPVSNLVVGAGITGAAAARLLADRGEKVTVIDRRDHIAGNCYDCRDGNGIMVHRYGSHIFHTSDKEVWDFMCRFTEFNGYVHRVRGMVDGKEIPIPFNLDSLHMVFPKEKAERLERKLIDAYGYGRKVPILEFQRQDDGDLRDLADYVYEKVFLHYTMKQWGYSPEEVDAGVTARVPVYISRDDRYFQDPYQGIPVEGYTKALENMLDHPNIRVVLNTEYSDDKCGSYDRILHTGSIDEYMGYRYGCLPYRSVRFDMETICSEHYQSNSVINYPCDQAFTRIHEYKYYLGDVSERTVIAREYSEVFELGKNERYYPIPRDENTAMYERYLRDIGQEKVHFLGRLGDYRYYNMDGAIRRAMDVVSSLN